MHVVPRSGLLVQLHDVDVWINKQYYVAMSTRCVYAFSSSEEGFLRRTVRRGFARSLFVVFFEPSPFSLSCFALRRGSGSEDCVPVTFEMSSRLLSMRSCLEPSRFLVGGGRSTATRAPQSTLPLPERDAPRVVDERGIDTERSGFFEPVSIAEILSRRKDRFAGCGF